MGVLSKLFGNRSKKCGGCGKTLQSLEEASNDFPMSWMASHGDPLAEMQAKMYRLGKALATPAYRCNKCGKITCRGCSRNDMACAKCGSTDTNLC
jgi:hypothetical protein